MHGWGVGGGRLGRFADLGDVFSLFQHAEGGAECQVTDHVESQVVEPVQAVDLGVATVGVVGERVPLLDEEFEVLVHVDFELGDALGGEGVGDGLALSGVLYSVSCVEETALDGDKGIVVVAGVER